MSKPSKKLHFARLIDTPLEAIVACFNDAFKGYFIPINLSQDQLALKIQTENIDLRQSVGAFDGDKLVGFILHGHRLGDQQEHLYNAGTGVIASHRGQGLTTSMYAFLLEQNTPTPPTRYQLEVISENQPAIKVYQRIGYVKKRTLDCYKGTIVLASPPQAWDIKIAQDIDWRTAQTFWDIEPSWQNAIPTLDLLGDKVTYYTAYDGDRLVAYLAAHTQAPRIYHIAVDPRYRRQGLATHLLASYQHHHGSSASITNVDSSCAATHAFLTQAGLEIFLQQDEMVMQG